MTTGYLTMWDSIDESLYPETGCFAGYVDGSLGDQPDYQWLAANRPGFPLLSIALFAKDDAEALDIEGGAATPQSAAAWYERQKARGVARPCFYASASVMESDVVPVIKAAGIARPSVRLWTAHYDTPQGEHICGPGSCGQLSIDADGTQWTSNALGRDLDQSLLLPDFFGTAPSPEWTEIDLTKLPVLEQGAKDEPGSTYFVARLQALVACVGHINGLPAAEAVADDGQFGPATTAGVKAVQTHFSLADDGICGAATWGVLVAGTPG